MLKLTKKFCVRLIDFLPMFKQIPQFWKWSSLSLDTKVQIRDFIILEGQNKNLKNTRANQVDDNPIIFCSPELWSGNSSSVTWHGPDRRLRSKKRKRNKKENKIRDNLTKTCSVFKSTKARHRVGQVIFGIAGQHSFCNGLLHYLV